MFAGGQIMLDGLTGQRDKGTLGVWQPGGVQPSRGHSDYGSS